ncbi:ABC transporter ATP-binding protein [Methylorubrum extorquens]|jgi:urea transport system ATP-binding protein|uniref:Urea ABC transporter, ATP-binding protein UrtE n=2 Tax=Methylorubrum extorquens TaxID=408 RepID=B7KS11_METC4|nr:MULTISPECIES: urea ABC transporter ATP-binding subunit UrtE [Methylorubrum]ACK82373.1 urea ABC transporter, ATP-binding protein UrtE [Methylorubrum extorquens CM4]APX83414.1 ABC transporter ATP-binding protein [Methylorubrum extorquens]ARO55116.1 ABC transporter ATP-binding protein [Methylorubrum zatmanii]MCG5248955.1 urea ABC transporter ATP-binding subunit UrtE [Methylorubrum extorquens]UYW27558.1 urea ABC transporter ATP-binding subunit UrtE [Methylorubrum extorquens]
MLLDLDRVTSYYGKTPILKDVGLGLPEGQCLCVLGRNGVGKTTLLRTIMGLTDRTSGEIRIAGDAITKAPTHVRAKYGLGYIPQGRQILPHFTVKENILLGTFARTDGRQDVPELCLTLFPYLAQNLHRKAGLLSGGQQQQLAIARALATNPRILLLDEPTEGIQPNIVAEIGQTLGRLNKEFGITLILTEQHIKVARKLGDAFLMMENGRVVARGPIGEMTDELVERHMTI